MNYKIVLKEDVPENSGFVVESLNLNNNSISFVHNIDTGLNCFNQNSICHILGISQDRVSKWLNKYKEQISDNMLFEHIIPLRLEINRNNDTVLFYSFDALTYVSYKIDTPEAISYRNMVNDILNKMFNVVTGKDDIDTKLIKLAKMQEAEQFKSDKYLEAYKALIPIDKEKANECYHLHKVSYHNSLNCHELLVQKNDWDKRFSKVQYDINGGELDNTKQLKLV